MDFFRLPQYRDMFCSLDEDGGFNYEWWGDAPVHSLAAAMLLRPEQVHHFFDFGYRHADFQYCTCAPTEEEKEKGKSVTHSFNEANRLWDDDQADAAAEAARKLLDGTTMPKRHPMKTLMLLALVLPNLPMVDKANVHWETAVALTSDDCKLQ
ncbi:glycosyltransferase family 15 protein [Macroventuria anomochaeta]|uniref:Glycosyltransferase family 15 protein n=1 Tax=Macroventuria anomochaeta TaxID=301207 RepID=A0ACB6S6Y2_9PLEO|nr:glycosyltransferase family 15 protein [Macroventuria anomochaeta]KAF2629762.1 glycosyltransferase family 15 protein [Macroventuria anomochaeta]